VTTKATKTPECNDCIDEGITTWRPITSGTRVKRCATHDRLNKRAAKIKRANAHIEKTYGISADDYWRLYEAQGGKCAICWRGKGKSKLLSVEHDHTTGEIFGLCCGTCNTMLGRVGRTIDPYVRTINYLLDPPARQVFGEPRYVPNPEQARMANLEFDENVAADDAPDEASLLSPDDDLLEM
jgi:hypothetical protein